MFEAEPAAESHDIVDMRGRREKELLINLDSTEQVANGGHSLNVLPGIWYPTCKSISYPMPCPHTHCNSNSGNVHKSFEQLLTINTKLLPVDGNNIRALHIARDSL